MDMSTDGRNSGHHGNLFGGTVFDNPSFLARKPTPEEQAWDLQWDEEERANDLKAAAKAAQFYSKTLNRLACIKKTLVPEDHLGTNNEELPKDDGGATLIKKISDCRKRERKQRWEELVGAATKVIPPPAITAPLVITPTPLSTVEEASSTPVHSRPVQAPRSITPKASQLSSAFASVRQHDLLIVTAGLDSLSALSSMGASQAHAAGGLPSALKSSSYPLAPNKAVLWNDAKDKALRDEFNSIGIVEPGSPGYEWFLQLIIDYKDGQDDKMTLLLGFASAVEILLSVHTNFCLLPVDKNLKYPAITSGREIEGFPTTAVIAFKYILLCNKRMSGGVSQSPPVPPPPPHPHFTA
jgi:hypothetical protein